MTEKPTPRIVVTVGLPAASREPAIAARKNELYADGIRRFGGAPVLLDTTSTIAERAAAIAAMDGLLLTGGADLDPALYGHADAGSRDVDRGRDELEAAAWAAADARGVPVLGICRGFQAINVFAGGTLLQHVDAHHGADWGHGPAGTHPIRLDAASRVGALLAGREATGSPASTVADPAAVGGDPSIVVNTYHHQAVRPVDLAAGLRACGWADSPAGEIVEVFEADGDRFVVGVQCHPERTESTPPSFESLWAAFVDACRG